ncbi:uncharacterized protein LOC142162297 [Nicotiana tabacum]|uniref:Uncharacterized protein LOC142162297 n=1 Tax=Nicotiana tabacum TaxID=4097 RepID=A0AC58RPR9_TOBAC
MESQGSALKNLEIQLSQLATLVSEKIQRPFPSNTEKNPKEHLKAIALRSGKELNEPYADQSEQQVNKGKNVEIPYKLSEDKEVKKKEEKNIEKLTLFPVTITFPQKLKRENLDNQFSKFLEILEQIHINIPFTDTLLQMPSYAKFLKEILSSSFTIPCTLGGIYFEKALCDSVALINLMQFSIFRKLNLGEMKDIGVSLQLADQSTKKPKGIIKNVLIRVDKFIFPVDFIVLEMKECPDEPIILGRPFLATGQEEKLIEVLKVHKGALGWTIKDIKGINPAVCMHKILMEDSYKPIVQPQRRLNLAMQEVVKKEIVKLLVADNIIRRCVPEEEMNKILYHCHDGAIGGHYAANRTAFKVLEAEFFWQTLFKDARAYVAQGNRCQRKGNITKRDEILLQSIQVNELEEMSRLRLFPGKLKSRWTGPYNVTNVTPYGAIEIQQKNGGDKFTVTIQPGHLMKASTKTESPTQEQLHGDRCA